MTIDATLCIAFYILFLTAERILAHCYSFTDRKLIGNDAIQLHPFASIRVHSRPLASNRVQSHPIASIRIHSRPLASARIQSHPIASIRIDSHRFASGDLPSRQSSRFRKMDVIFSVVSPSGGNTLTGGWNTGLATQVNAVIGEFSGAIGDRKNKLGSSARLSVQKSLSSFTSYNSDVTGVAGAWTRTCFDILISDTGRAPWATHRGHTIEFDRIRWCVQATAEDTIEFDRIR
jgi:hypothetical protein